MAKDAENNMAITLTGVVSAGSTCADKDYPGLYTDVKKYCTDGWLEEQIAGAQTCGRPPAEHIEDTTTTTAATTTTAVPTPSTESPDSPTNSKLEKSPEETLAVLIIGGDG